MKFLYGLLAAINIGGGPATVLAAKEPDTVKVEDSEGLRTMSQDTDIKAINKTINDIDIVDYEGQKVIKSSSTIKLLLNEKQDKFFTDTRFKSMYIRLTYNVEVNNPFMRSSATVPFTFNTWVANAVHSDFSLAAKDGREHAFTLGLVESDFSIDEKTGRSVFNIKPYLTFNKEAWEGNENKRNKHGFLRLIISKVSLIGKFEEYDLTKIKVNPMKVNWQDYEADYLKKWSDDMDGINKFVSKEYGLPEDFVDVEMTKKNFKYDQLNPRRELKYGIEIVPNKKYFTKGTLIQEVNFFVDNKEQYLFEHVKTFRSSDIFEKFKYIGINPEDTDIKIVLEKDTNYVSVKNYKMIEFIDDDAIKDATKFKKISVVFNDKEIALMKNNKWNVKDQIKLGDLADEYFKDQIKPDEPEDKKEDAVKDDKNKKNDKKQSKNNDEFKKEKVAPKKKSNHLKYLWFLTIPIAFGLVSLLSWIIPFRKKKKCRNDIK